MRSSLRTIAAYSTLLHFASAAPAAAPETTPGPDFSAHVERDLIGGLLGGVDNLLNGVVSKISSAVEAGNPSAVYSQLASVSPTSKPTAASQVKAQCSSVWGSAPQSSPSPVQFWGNMAWLVQNGYAPTPVSKIPNCPAYTSGSNSHSNTGNRKPSTSIYPKKDPLDAVYSIAENLLREALFIPTTFTYGKKIPTIMVPGTGQPAAFLNFQNNLATLLTGVPYADPVFLNLPSNALLDIQLNAQYVAYAINYISKMSQGSQVSVITWSQGSLDTQWAFKYWPSTRKLVSDFIPISGDFHGTVEANALCLSLGAGTANLNPCNPSVIQQEYNSKFITTLRRNGGDSAYVPTTSIASALFDEIVQPQLGTTGSFYINDARSVGVTNAQPQTVCPGQPAGGFYGHAGMLYNPVTFALIVDALKNPGPGNVSRLDLATVCAQSVAPGLSLNNVLLTEGIIIVSAVNILLGQPRITIEPAIMSYATY